MNIPEGTPLIVVDMQNGFINPKSEHVVEPVRTLASEWARRGWPMFFTKFINAPGSQWQEWLDWERLQVPPETDITSALSDLTPLGLVVEKRMYTAMSGVIADQFESHAWKTAVICGVATDGCVMETAVDLFQARIRPLVVVDACASHAGNETHEMGLHLLRRSIGPKQLVTLRDILEDVPQVSGPTSS